MTIKTKLAFNAIVTAIGIIIIAAFSLSGMKFVQKKLHILTEKSTPYQLKTIALQRSLQEHISNLLKTTTAATESEIKQLKIESAKSLDDVRKITADVSALKGGGESTSKLQELESISSDIITTVEERIKSENAGKSSHKNIDAKLDRLRVGLDKMAITMKTNQKKLVGELSSTNDSVKRGSVKNTVTQTLISSLNELKVIVLEIIAAEQKNQIDAALTRFNTTSQSIIKSLFMRTEKNTPLGKEITSVITEITKQINGVGGIAEQKANLIAKNADISSSKISQDVNTAVQKISRLSNSVVEFSSKINEGSREEGKKFDKTLENSVLLSDHLAGNSELISYGGLINDYINDVLQARTIEELDIAKNNSISILGKATTLLNSRMKSIPGASALVGILNEVKSSLVSENGAYNALNKIIHVNKRLIELNNKLKNLVMEQQKEGEAGISSARDEQEKAVASVNKMFRNSIIGVALIGATILLTGILAGFFLTRSITRPIKELKTLAEGFGSGDFSCSMNTNRKDEFGELAINFNASSLKMQEIVIGLTNAIKQLKTSSDKLNNTSTRLKSGAQEQANQAEQSATALEQMTRTISGVAQNANQAAEATKDSSSVAASGKETVAEAVESMIKIAASVSETAEMIQKLGDSSSQIGTIIDVINDIADQTNLLALNAAIEAARAGEMGMGFAVVANEVRNLARRTTDATQEITIMIKDIQRDTSLSIKTMESGKNLASQGVELAGRARDALESIVSASDRGADMVVQIATASEEQSMAASEVSSGVQQMSELTKYAEEDSKLISEEAHELSRIAEDLSQKAEWFKFNN